VLLLAHGEVKAGVDLAKLAPGDVRISGDRISLALPPAQITDAFLDERQTQVVERSTGLLRSFDKDLESSARQQALDDIRRAARRANILAQADEKARAQLANLFHQLGFARVEFRGETLSSPAPVLER
jgi:multidrug efflux pump subunit AcrA (membrane-fusion protein)